MLRKRKRDEHESSVPPLATLAEAALQRAYELRCESLQLEPSLRKFARIIAPVVMNGELCRLVKGRPAIE